MAERYRSQDGTRETGEVLGYPPEEAEGGPDEQVGRSGGNIARKVGTRDEEKRAGERPAPRTGVLGQDQSGSGDKEGV